MFDQYTEAKFLTLRSFENIIGLCRTLRDRELQRVASLSHGHGLMGVQTLAVPM